MKEEIPQKVQNPPGAENGRFARHGVSSQFKNVFMDLNGAFLQHIVVKDCLLRGKFWAILLRE